MQNLCVCVEMASGGRGRRRGIFRACAVPSVRGAERSRTPVAISEDHVCTTTGIASLPCSSLSSGHKNSTPAPHAGTTLTSATREGKKNEKITQFVCQPKQSPWLNLDSSSYLFSFFLFFFVISGDDERAWGVHVIVSKHGTNKGRHKITPK